jgi:cell division transport system permease protein
MTPNNESARRSRRPAPIIALRNWLLRHLQTLLYTLGQIVARPMNTLLTTAVIGIALAMPTALHVILSNVAQGVSGWESTTQITLYLKRETSDREAIGLATRLKGRPAIATAVFIPASQALEEFRRLSGFGSALDALSENPLPALVIVQPAAHIIDPRILQQLVTNLGEEHEVELAQLDMEWVNRLFALMEIGQRGVLLLGGLLALAVVLVVGNTIRLAIQNRREEIIVMKLIGATDAFIRRPFLYTGLWYGLAGGAIAAILVEGSIIALHTPVAHLAQLYNSSFTLGGLSLATLATVTATSIVLGLGGSWLAVGRHLRDIEPT